MFLENLWREMDKVSSPSSDKSISRVAAKYASEGYDESEVVELLVADGFDQYAAKACVAEHVAEASEDDDGDGQEWGFEAEDQRRGDVVSNHDVKCASVNASNENAAWEKAQAFLDENCSDQYAVTKVYQI